MAITKETEIGKIEVVTPYKAVQVRTDTVIKEDGVELNRAYNRHVLHSGKIDDSNVWSNTDISSEDDEVQAIANVVWTQAVKDSWTGHLIAEKEG